MDRLESMLAPLLRVKDAGDWRPVLFDAGEAEARKRLHDLLETHAVRECRDTMRGQLHELLETRTPSRDLAPAELETMTQAHLAQAGAASLEHYGTWAYFPWSRRLVRALPEAEYRELRTSRNRNKITADEQKVLVSKRIGIVGLSVGSATAVTLAMEEVGGEYVLADFDSLSLSNMNRLRTGLHNVGVNKAVLTAREIFEINPYAKIELFSEGLTETNLERFLGGPRPLDLLIEECDDFYVKLKVRTHAKALRIPVLMETSDRGLLDIERFDLEPERPILHGLVEGVNLEKLKSMTAIEKIPLGLDIIGGSQASARLAASALEVKATLKTWPQLASAVTLGGATSTDTARRMFLGELRESGRYYVDVDDIIADGKGVVIERSQVGKGISTEATRETTPMPALTKSTSGAKLTEEQVRTLVTYGAMAPSGGNSQPWRFVFERNQLHCLHDAARSKSFLDYENLASFVSFGAVVENISLVAEQQGLTVEVDPFPDSSRVCTLRFSSANRPARDRALFEQIAKRVANRKAGVREAVPVADQQALIEAAQARGGALTLIDDPTRLQGVADLLGPGDRLRFMSRTMHEELVKEVRWTVKEVEATRDGLDVATLELNPVDLAGMRLASAAGVMHLVGKLGGGRALERPSRMAIAGASAVGLVTMPGGHTPRAMFEGGRALQRVWLTATHLGYAVQPMTALVCLFWRLLGGGDGLSQAEVTQLGALRQKYVEVLDVPRGSAEVMLFRLARAEAPTARSLRRPVDEVLTIT